MKRRAHYILEKLNWNNENQNNTDKENIAPSTSSAEENLDTFILTWNEMITENTPETENKTSTPSPSIIENSPDKSIPNFDPKTFPLYNTKSNELQMLSKIEDFIKEAITPEQANSSSSTSSSSSSSSRSSSSSSSSSNSTSRINNSNAHSIIDGPSTSKLPNQVASRTTNVNKNYHQSPINSNESDVDLSDSDPTYCVDRSRLNLRKTTCISSFSSSSSSSTNTAINADNCNNNSVPETTRSHRKRTRDPSKWKQNLAKHLRNSGKAYVSCTTM